MFSRESGNPVISDYVVSQREMQNRLSAVSRIRNSLKLYDVIITSTARYTSVKWPMTPRVHGINTTASP
jgi:hypothetical protein